MMQIIRARGGFGIRCPSYSKLLHAAAKETPGMSWDRSSMAWVGWPDAVRECARRLQKRGAIVDGELPKRRALVSRNCTAGVPVIYIGTREYQVVGANFLISLAGTGALLADDLGLGKTRQALMAIEALAKDAIVVCPSFVRSVWLREIAKWLPDARVVGLNGTKPQLLTTTGFHGQCIFLVHYDIVYAWAELLKKSTAKTIVFDEIHYLLSDKSRRSLACKEIARAMKYRIGLSGTPMTSRPRDLWNPIDTLCPGRFGHPFPFLVAHAGGHQIDVETRDGPKTVWDFKGASRLKELNRRLRFFMLRRTKSDVRMELPPRTRQIVEIEVAKTFRVKPSNALRSTKALRVALTIAANGKLKTAIEMIASHVENGSKVVVGTYRKAVAEFIAASLRKSRIDVAVITGEVSQKKRVAIVDAQHDVICCTMDSTSVGIDLSYADVAVCVELDYVPSKLIQWEGRVYRFGQKKNVLIQYVIALGSADELVRDVVLSKLEHFEEAIGKTDDKLNEDLGGSKKDTLEQLRSLAKKIQQQENK